MADPLDFAWFEYAPAELKEQYREAGKNPSMTATLHRLMTGEVQLKIADRELVALGVQTAPIPQDYAREISPTFFQAASIQIDWSRATVTGLGQAFAEVRVCVPQTRHITASVEPVQTDEGAFLDEHADTLPTKRGPKSAGGIIRRIYAELIETGDIPNTRTRKEAWVIVRARAMHEHPEEFPGERGLSYSSFARHVAVR